MKKFQNFLEWNNDVFTSSMKKINFDIILILILDSLFYLISGYLIILWLQRIQEKIQAFNLPSDVVSLGREGAQRLASEVKSFYFLIIFSFILVLLAVIFLASILKGIIWAKTTKTNVTFRLISKFLVLNLIWMGFWFLVIFLVSYLVVPASVSKFMVLSIILSLYLTNTLYTLFMKEDSIRNIFAAVKINATKIHLFLLPNIVKYLFYFIVMVISSLFFSFIKLDSILKFSYTIALPIPSISSYPLLIVFTVSRILLLLLLIGCFTVARYYTSTLVLKLENL